MTFARDKANQIQSAFRSVGVDDNADTLAITIDSSEKVGIGNTSPKAALHVTGSNGILVESENTNGDGQIYFGDTTGTDRLYLSRSLNDFAIWNVSDGIIKLATNNAERMRITSAGKVGIGVTNPAVTMELAGNGGAIRLPTGGELQFGGANNLILGNSGSNYLKFNTNGAEKVRIDSSGRVGIGTSSPSQLLEVQKNQNSDTAIKIINQTGGSAARASLFLDAAGGGVQLMAIDYNFNTSGVYQADAGLLASDTAMSYGLNIASRSTSSTASLRFYTADVERLEIDREGNLVFNDSQLDCNFRIKSDGLNDMIFVDAGNNRVGIGTDAPDYMFQVEQTANTYATNIRNLHTSEPFGLFMKYTSASPDNSSSQFLVCQDSGTTRMVMHSDGDCYNHDGVFAQISDRRIKQNITDASSQWDDIKAIKVRNFERKDDVRAYGEGEKIQIGVIGQELEAVSPKLVKELEPDFSDILSDSSFGTVYTADDAETQDAVLYTADDQKVIDGTAEVGDIKTPSTKQVNDIKSLTGEKVKGVKYSILYMKAIKALQEAMDRIETLEAKVTTLENN